MHRMRRLCAVMLCGVVLCACAPAPMEGQPPASELPLTSRILHFQVSSRLSPEVLVQTDAFADRVAKLSNGMIQIEVTTGLTDSTTVQNGVADFAFVRNLQMIQADEIFAMLSLPFLYDTPMHMSAALNSDRVLKLLEERLTSQGMVPLAAVYSGSNFLATDDHELRKPSDYKELVIAMRTDNVEKLKIFEALGAQVLPYSQTTVTPLLGTEVEILPEDLSKPSDIVRVDTVELTLDQGLQLLPDPNTLYFIKTYHTISPLWVIADKDLISQLNAYELAILQESLAGLISGVELERSAREQMLTEEIRKQGIAVSDVDRTRATVANYIYGSKGTGTDRYTPPDYFDHRLYKIIQDFA